MLVDVILLRLYALDFGLFDDFHPVSTVTRRHSSKVDGSAASRVTCR